jgi:hypothetical protein
MKTQHDEQATTNNTLDIAHPALDDAYKKLKETNPNAVNVNQIEKLFEDTYKCKIDYSSAYVGGTVTFNTNKDLVWFLLKYDSTGKTDEN